MHQLHDLHLSLKVQKIKFSLLFEMFSLQQIFIVFYNTTLFYK